MASRRSSDDLDERVYDQLRREFHVIAQAKRGHDEAVIVSALRSAVRRHRGEDVVAETLLRRCARAIRTGGSLPAF